MTEELMERVPPQHIEAEQAVLGAVMLEADAMVTVSEILQVPDFYRKSHQMIYEAILTIAESGEPVDIVTVSKTLADSGHIEEIGGVAYLANLANSVPTAANVDHYASIVKEKSVLRRLINTATKIASTGYQGGDVNEMISDAEKKIMEISHAGSINKGFTPIKDVLLNTFERIEFLYSNKGGVTGISSGYPDLDKMTNGFQRSDLIILAARPAVGKTAFALNVAQNVAVRSNQTVAIFSLEMGKEQLVQRMLCAEANIDAGRMRSGFLDEDDWPKLTMAVGTLSEAPIFIDDTPGITVTDIRAKCRRLKAEHGLGMVLIDYLQLISGNGRTDNRQQEVSEISRTLKLIARELDTTVIALSQLSRSVESRQDKRPMMSDLRESGSIEQDADIVSFLYRDDYYNPETERKNIVEFIIAKQRSGPTGTVELVFLKNFNKFVSLERAPGA
ncbi:replicative DNA helicase [Tumebacillus permanentifrigoris]|uniref:Replicative DNA helicase n=1 Tax=Tumebacillus permanentifrigoris TaxID=378543 RepID=A0A316DES5_9BACL|nr:replicative DNA helicase [Tumebacillus permanentifrigoris]PWK16544.1 primary replicative DNA helicase [Tumebacillus permanentifrigoris]